MAEEDGAAPLMRSRLDQTEVLPTLEGLAQRLRRLNSIGFESDEDLDALRRAERVVTLAHGTIDRADPDLTSVAIAAQMIKAAASADNALDHIDPEYSGNTRNTPQAARNRGSWRDELLKSTDTIIAYTSRFTVVLPDDELASSRRLVENLHQRIRTTSQAIDKQMQGAEKKLQSLQEKIDSSGDTAKDQLAELTAAISEERGRLDSAIQNYEKLFRDGQDDRTKRFQEEVVNVADEEIEKLIRKGTSEVDLLLDEMQTRRREVEAVAGAVGGSAFGSRFEEVAEAELKSGHWWRRVAAVTGAVLGVAGIVAFFVVLIRGVDDLAALAGRAALFSPAALFAFYAARLSSAHMAAARRARAIQLDLLALDPFLATMSNSEEAQTIRGVVALRWFGSDARGASPTATELAERVASRLLRGRRGVADQQHEDDETRAVTTP